MSIEIDITTDNYPEETSWELTNKCTGVVVKSTSGYTEANKSYSYSECMEPAKYEFKINDSYGDGICCSYGNGNFAVRENGIPVVDGGGQFSQEESKTFGLCPNDTPAPQSQPTTSPTRSPTILATVATYDSDLGVPRCSTIEQSCSSGDLLVSRQFSDVETQKELNGSNTLDSCTDGASGTYKNDESIEQILVRATGGALQLQAGNVVEIEAVVWPYGNGGADYADFYHTDDAGATDPVWKIIGTVHAIGVAGENRILSVPHTLTVGSLQAVRVNFRYQGEQSPCSAGSYDDHDDLVFPVAPAPAELVDASPIVLAPIAPVKHVEIKCETLEEERCEDDASSTCRWQGGKSGMGHCVNKETGAFKA